MAKENTVYLYGYVPQNPVIRISPEREFLSGKLVLTTIRRSYVTEEMFLKGNIRWDSPCVFSKNAKLIEKQIMDVNAGDLVYIKGTLCTMETPKKFKCPNPECNHVTVKENGVVVYVDPVFVKKVGHCETKDEAYEILKSMDEISNQVYIMGTLCREPVYYEDENSKKKECQFQIASNRNRHILEDDPDKRTDYPWVKSFGKRAEEYVEALHTGSSIYMNGAIETREITTTIQCEACGLEYERPGVSMEIVPYHVEYMQNCNIPNSKDEGDTEDDEE